MTDITGPDCSTCGHRFIYLYTLMCGRKKTFEDGAVKYYENGTSCQFERNESVWENMEFARAPGDICGEQGRHWTPKPEFKVE